MQHISNPTHPVNRSLESKRENQLYFSDNKKITADCSTPYADENNIYPYSNPITTDMSQQIANHTSPVLNLTLSQELPPHVFQEPFMNDSDIVWNEDSISQLFPAFPLSSPGEQTTGRFDMDFISSQMGLICEDAISSAPQQSPIHQCSVSSQPFSQISNEEFRAQCDVETIHIPEKISLAQSVVDYDHNRIYVIGSFNNPKIFIFDIKSKKYESNSFYIPNYDSIGFMPDYHCVIPLLDYGTNQLRSILSFGGGFGDDHFAILERDANDSGDVPSSFQWNTNPLCAKSMPYPNVGINSKAVNINNNIHIIGGNKNSNNHFVYTAKQQCLHKQSKIDTLKGVTHHGLSAFGNLLIILGGMDKNQRCSDKIHYRDLTKPNKHWHVSKHSMPQKMCQFGLVAIENTNLALIVGGVGSEPLDTIYIFSGEALESDESDACFTLSKQRLPMPLSSPNCIIVHRQLHIIGARACNGLNSICEPTDAHYIIDLDCIIQYLKTNDFNSIINYWIRNGNMRLQMPYDLVRVLGRFCGFHSFLQK